MSVGVARRALVAAGGSLLLTLAACGDGDQEPSPNDGPAGTQNADSGDSGDSGASGDADIQAGSGPDPESVNPCALGLDAIKAALGEDAHTINMGDTFDCYWEGTTDQGDLLQLSINVDYAEEILEPTVGSDYYESLDGLGDKAFVQDENDVVSIRWEHDGLGVLLQEQYGDWEPDELVTIAQGIDDDLP